MKYTDKIWTAFEQDFKTFPMPPGVEIIAFEAYKAAYAKGQRDLIEAMGEPVAWKHKTADGWHRVFDTFSAKRPPKEEEEYFRSPSIPLYRLPEDTPK